MGARSDLTGGDAAPATPSERELDPTAVDDATPVARRHTLGRVGVIVLGVAVLALVVAVAVMWGGDGPRLPAEATPAPGDELAEVDVARADGPTGLPDMDPDELAAPVHTVTAACDLTMREFPSSSTYGVLSGSVTTADGPTVCAPQPLADGRLIATVGWGTEELSVAIIDPQHPGDGPEPGPTELSDSLVHGSTVQVVGAVEETGEVLVARNPFTSQADAVGSSLVAVDVDSGEEREVLAPGAVGGPESAIGAAQLRDGHLVVVTGEGSAMRPHALAALGHRGTEATEIWFGPVDGELVPVRQPTPVPEFGVDVVLRDLLPPRIVDGADGPLVASFEHVVPDEVWQLVLTAPDGASRVVAELGDPDAAEGSSGRLFGRPAGGSFDAVGTQMLIAGTMVGGDGAQDGDQTVLLLDLADGTWSRLPVKANVASFVHGDR